MLLSDKIFEEYVTEKRYLKNIAFNTEQNYRQSWKAYKKYAPGGLEIELSKAQLNRWVIAMREAGVKPKSCNTFITAINTFVHWLYDNELLPHRIGATLLKLPDPSPTAVSEHTINLLANFKPKNVGEWRTHIIVSLLIDTGMRIDEALGCQLKNVDFNQSLVTITGKGGKTRIIPFSFEMRKRLWNWNKKRGDNPSPYLFPTSTFGRMEYHNFRRDLKVVLKRLKITERVHAHAIRHYFAVNFLRSGGDLFRLSKILGHANISVTEIYLQSMPTAGFTESHRLYSPLVKRS